MEMAKGGHVQSWESLKELVFIEKKAEPWRENIETERKHKCEKRGLCHGDALIELVPR